ncbi:MAG: hypothetical protein AAB421_00115 [Patescibacteria group bacterium]
MHTLALWVVVAASGIMGAVALLSGWGILAPEMWWQALLSLGVVMVTMWTAIGAMRFMNNQVDGFWIPREAVWVLVGVVLLYVTILPTLIAPAYDDSSLYYDDYLTGLETDLGTVDTATQ